MIDISDGLGKDAAAVASSSNVRFMLEASLIHATLVLDGKMPSRTVKIMNCCLSLANALIAPIFPFMFMK